MPAAHDVVWGPAEHLAIGYARDPVVRYRGSTGGVLTALGQFLLTSGRVKFILHVAASGREPLRTLTFVCGGASDLTKSEEVVSEVGIRPEELSSFRYRGNGCPGPTRLETQDGRSFELTYQDMWEDEATWRIQPRCKICPDAIGESADLAASDVWPGGGPAGEDEGFNGIIVRTRRGLELYRAALEAGAIVPAPVILAPKLSGRGRLS